MPDLPTRILSALDEALAQEIGARLRQAALNSPPSSGGATTLPPRFEEGLLRLKTMHAQAKVLVRKTFAAAESGALQTSAVLNLSGSQENQVFEAPSYKDQGGAARPVIARRSMKRGLPRQPKKRAAKKKD
jgi:hypothetical protein